MPEETTGQNQAENNNGDRGNNEFAPITSQDQLDKLIGGRINAVKQQYADYDDLKSKAAKLDEAEDAKKSELQKLEDRNRSIEQENAQLKTANLRAEVAAAKGVPTTSLTGTTREELEKSADDLIAWRDEHTSKTRTPPPQRQLRSGSAKPDPALTKKEQAAAALREMRANR